MFGIAVLVRTARAAAASLREGLESLRARATADRPADPDELVTIATYDKSTNAHIALGRLAAEGIPAQLFDSHMVQMESAIALGGIKLRVSRSDAEAARKVLETDYSAALEDVEGQDGE